MSSIVKCLVDLKARVQSSAVTDTPKIVFTSEELASLIKQAGSDLEVGVVYHGLASISDGEGATQKGIAGKAQFGLYLAFQVSAVTQEAEARKLHIITTLDTLRLTILTTQAPTGHKWEFVSEGFADTIGPRTIWVQQWRTTVVK
jgi:hypothetical protein